MPFIGFVDDRVDMRISLARILEPVLAENWRLLNISPLDEPEEYPRWLTTNDVWGLLVDWRLDETGAAGGQSAYYKGSAIVESIRASRPDFPIFVVTSYADDDDLRDELGEVEGVFERRDVSSNPTFVAKRLVRAASRFHHVHNEELAELSHLSGAVAVGSATEADRTRLSAIREHLGLALGPGSPVEMSTVLDEAERLLEQFEALREMIGSTDEGTTPR